MLDTGQVMSLEPKWPRTGQLAREDLGVTDTPEKGVDLSAWLTRRRADGTYSTTTYRVDGHTLGWIARGRKEWNIYLAALMCALEKKLLPLAG